MLELDEAKGRFQLFKKSFLLKEMQRIFLVLNVIIHRHADRNAHRLIKFH